MKTVHILSGGAAQGLVSQLQPIFQTQNSCQVEGSYGAVGLMRDKLLAGEACDVLILTQALIEQLTSSGQVRAGSARPLGRVRTGVAVKNGEVSPQVDNPAALKQALRGAKGVYFPDPLKATAGIHFMSVLQQLGLDKELAARLHVFPNGATAMRAMAQAGGSGLIGCTQITEILYTPGVHLVAPLPKEFELSTVYVAAVCKRAQSPQEATALVELLASEQATQLRRAGGFE
jgi:molybdate transport system substrate-binding protein